MKVVTPVPVTDAILAASSVPEADYPAWAAGTSYALGDRVIRGATHRIYESAVADNVGNDPADPAATGWFDVGPTNRWAMFDRALGYRTMATGSITVTLSPGAPVAALAVLDADAASVRVEVAAGDYDETRAVAGRSVVAFLDLPDIAADIIVTITGAGPIAVGKLLIGGLIDLGDLEASPTIGITDFSKRATDEFGTTTVVERGWSKTASMRTKIATEAVDGIQRRVAALRARPTLWIGEEGYDSLSIYGFFKSFSVDIALPTISYCSIGIEGLAA